MALEKRIPFGKTAFAAVICFVAQSSGAAALDLGSPAFADKGAMPARLTCTDAGHSTPLAWSGVPSTAKSLALIVNDPDAPDPQAPTKDVTHWVIYDMSPSITALAEGLNKAPSGARDGLNARNAAGYMPPCPPVGRHRYFHRLYALDTVLPDLGMPTRAQLEAAMKGHVVESAELIGTYAK